MPSVPAAFYKQRFCGKSSTILVLLLVSGFIQAAGGWKVREEVGRFREKYSRHIHALDKLGHTLISARRRDPIVIRQIEESSQRYWDENYVFRAHESAESTWNVESSPAALQKEKNRRHEILVNETSGIAPKFYGLCMIPYPSGDGLHVGHLLGYTVLDVICRYKRMRGYHVLNPIGWDSFGLPAERYAESVEEDVKKVTQRNIDNFKRQLKRMGFSYDWSREIATSEPSYYRWTQWMFQQFYKQGIAYREEGTVNWCPQLGTVLANEEVKNGRSERGGFPVYRKPMEQWFLRITQYAKRLADDLSLLSWPSSIVYAQKKWIGLENGYKVTFRFAGGKHYGQLLYGFETDLSSLAHVESIELSTDMETLASFLEPSALEQVTRLQKEAINMSNLERYEHKKRVDTGICVINPLNGERIKVYVTNVPLVFSTPINCRIVKKEKFDGIHRNFCSNEEGKRSEKSDSPPNTVKLANGDEKDRLASCANTSAGMNDFEPFVNLKLRDWVFSRQRSWGEPIPLKCEGETYIPVDEALLPLEAGTGQSETMPQWAGSSWHFLRFCDPNNAKEAFSHKAAKYWMPVDIYVGGAEHAVSHLLYARFWNKVLYDMGISPVSEPFKSILLHGMIRKASFSHNGKPIDEKHVMKYKGKHVLKGDPNVTVDCKLEKMSKSKGNVVSPDGLVERYGADALRMHLLFLGPISKDKIWSEDGLIGVSKMLTRIDEFIRNVTITDDEQQVSDPLKLLIRKITKDIEKNMFNVAISDFFTFVSCMESFPIRGKLGRNVANTFLKLLSPFAPHIAENLWQFVNPDFKRSIANEEWPSIV